MLIKELTASVLHRRWKKRRERKEEERGTQEKQEKSFFFGYIFTGQQARFGLAVNEKCLIQKEKKLK